MIRHDLILLCIIQGLTEWLPISSTGHLKLTEIMLGLNLPLLFSLALHVGTLIVTIVFFRAEVKRVLRTLIKLDFRSEDGLIVKGIIVGSISTALVGLAAMALLEKFFTDGIEFIGLSFMTSGLIVYLSKVKVADKNHIDLSSALIIGAVQGLSIIPGLSRSGLTISVALMLGIRHEEAFKFSFLLSILAITGGLIMMLFTQSGALFEAGFGYGEMLIGALISMLLGFISLKIVRRLLRHFHKFALYPLLLGSTLILLKGLLT